MSGKPISQRQLAANRANALKSTGPRTPEGKARSSLNAVKHGLFARNIVLPIDDDESIAELDAVRTQFLRSLRPVNPLERWLIERLAATYWRFTRAYRFEVQAICQARAEADALLAQSNGQPHAAASPPTSLPAAPDLDRLLRYESMLDRALHRLTLQFAQLHAAARDASPPPPDLLAKPGLPSPIAKAPS